MLNRTDQGDVHRITRDARDCVAPGASRSSRRGNYAPGTPPGDPLCWKVLPTPAAPGTAPGDSPFGQKEPQSFVIVIQPARTLTNSFFRRKNLLNTYLIDEVIPPQINQVRSLLVVCQVRADPIDHHHYEGAISHIEPVAPSNKLARSISCKWAIGVSAKFWFVKAGHDRAGEAVGREVFHEGTPKV
jgi:hypothetical protein